MKRYYGRRGIAYHRRQRRLLWVNIAICTALTVACVGLLCHLFAQAI